MDLLVEFYFKFPVIFQFRENHNNEKITITINDDIMMFKTNSAEYKTSTYYIIK